MRRECRGSFPRQGDLATPTSVTHVSCRDACRDFSLTSVSFELVGWENVPDIHGAFYVSGKRPIASELRHEAGASLELFGSHEFI